HTTRLLAFSSGACAVGLAKAFCNSIAGSHPSRGRFHRKMHREPSATSDSVLGNPDQLYGGWDFAIETVAGRANCSWNAGRTNPDRWIAPIRSIYLRQDEKSVFHPPLRAI